MCPHEESHALDDVLLMALNWLRLAQARMKFSFALHRIARKTLWCRKTQEVQDQPVDTEISTSFVARPVRVIKGWWRARQRVCSHAPVAFCGR